MEQNIYFGIVILLMGIAVLDLVVGVSNDAVNFLNSSIGSKVANRRTIFIFASLGLFVGVLFSSGMMEVARKGIFNPQFFTMPDLMMLFFAVMIADLLILDLFNTYGLPTSTTVSIVFELLGAAVILSLIKIFASDGSISQLGEYINSARAFSIISGILLSVIISFVCGATAQFIGRLLFTFDYQSNLKTFGGLWGGLCMASIALFILLKGAKGATFITPEMSLSIKENLWLIFGLTYLISGVLFQALTSLFTFNIFKPIVLIGTFSLALAFAANDLVNFVGVPIASFHAYTAAFQTDSPLSVPMTMLAGKVPSTTSILVGCGFIMVCALWFSKKARTVTDTEIKLSSHSEGDEKFESLAISRIIVRIFISLFSGIRKVIPRPIRKLVRRRFSRHVINKAGESEALPSFDLVRASTNLMMASILVSFATSLKLPLSTTYVTFMVAMGTSFADHAWGRETAVYRITGVLTVIGGWFMTAFMAFTIAGLFCALLYYFGIAGGVLLLGFTGYSLWRTHHTHQKLVQADKKAEIFNLRKIDNAESARAETFLQIAKFLASLRISLNDGINAFFDYNRVELKRCYTFRKQIQRWSNIISANIFKVMRLMHQQGTKEQSAYHNVLVDMQGIAESYRDILKRSYFHVRANHRGLLSVQKKELQEVSEKLNSFMLTVECCLKQDQLTDHRLLDASLAEFYSLKDQLIELQNERVNNRSSKTRLSILYYALLKDMTRVIENTSSIYQISQESMSVQKIGSKAIEI